MAKFCCIACFNILLFLSVIGVATAGGYRAGTNPLPAPKSYLPQVFTVQGMVYCKSGHNKLSPVKGSLVRITCLGIDKYGYETAPFSVLTHPTDGNGYFLAKLSAKLLEEGGGVKISQCKAFFHSSPLKTCQLATDVNKGLSGAPLLTYRPIGSNGMRLYSVGPFVYSTTVPLQNPPFPYY